MRLLFLFLLCTPLAMAACPKMFEGLDARSFDVSELIEVACGLKSFSREFWSGDATKMLMKYMAADAIVQNATICSAECIEKLDKRHDIRALAPLAQSARESFDAMDNAEAKANVLGLYNNSYTYRLRELTVSDDFGLDELRDSFKFRHAHLSAAAFVAILRATKRAFGIEDSAEQNSENIAIAVNALRNAKLPRDAAEIAELIYKTQNLLKEVNESEARWFRIRDSFEMYALKVRTFDNEWIRAVEILPGAETLFLQYLMLENKEAKAFIDSFLKSLKESYDKKELTVIQDRWNGKHKQTTSDLGISEEAALALESTFPELFQYLYNNDYIVKKNTIIFKH